MDTSGAVRSRHPIGQLQRSHGFSAMDTYHSPSYRCRYSYLQWSYGSSAVDTTKTLSPSPRAPEAFKGATAFQPWILRTRRCGRLRRRSPSMEPQPFSHGYCEVGRYGGSCFAAFNGATAFQPWIRGKCQTSNTLSALLQWSHSLSAMDTGRPRCLMTGMASPSMEPQPFSHGYIPLVIIISAQFNLQWSHSLSAMDTSNRRITDHERLSPSMEPQPFSHGYSRLRVMRRQGVRALQWSHSLSAMDTVWPSPSTADSRRSFNGATAFQPWIRRCLRHRH